ncbi:MAG: nucleotide pyrophosphohydrolase [Promethearchaeota archaeon]|nr:MAG: nucleotide pyrophosphohydrolase [Candidatus Lokiarchaeota archaeon]
MHIREFQELIRQLYFSQDSKRGLNKNFLWLIEEIGELASNLKEEELNIEYLGEEMADIIAWVCTLANLLDIDIETALSQKYPNKCPKCGSNPCICNKNY